MVIEKYQELAVLVDVEVADVQYVMTIATLPMGVDGCIEADNSIVRDKRLLSSTKVYHEPDESAQKHFFHVFKFSNGGIKVTPCGGYVIDQTSTTY